MITLRQLKALALIEQTGSFTQAAERLFITQSAVSSLIRDLEREVGQPLVARGRHIHLTQAGKHLHAAGLRAHLELDRALGDIQGDSPWSEAWLRVGVGPLSAATLLPAAIADLRHRGSSLRVAVVDRPVRMLGDMLTSGETGVVLGALDAITSGAQAFDTQLLLEDTLCVVGSASHPLAALPGPLTWRQLRETELVLVGRGDGQWNVLLQDALASDGGLRVGYEVQLLSTALALVRHELGVAVLPRMATQDLDPGQYAVRELDSGDARWRTYWVRRHASDGDDAAAAELRAALQRVVAAYRGIQD
ncbi:MAG: LysR family transcriptional regulator [Pigmentiphaga sp.]